MLAQTDFFLVDVEFFEVENHFLFETLLVQFHADFFGCPEDFFLHGIQAFPFMGFHFVLEIEYLPHPGSHVPVESLPFP